MSDINCYFCSDAATGYNVDGVLGERTMTARAGSSKEWQKKRARVLNAFRHSCLYCGVKLLPATARSRDQKAHTGTIDHLTPESEGGSSGVRNLVAACHACNCRRDRTPVLQFALAAVGADIDAMASLLRRWLLALITLRRQIVQHRT